MTRDLELLTIGRVSVDLYPLQSGMPLRDVESFAKSIGGSPTNVAVAAARLGVASVVVTRVGDDDFGEYIRRDLKEKFGVDNRFVSTDPTLRTALAFCALDPPAEPPLLFYREPRGPEMNLTVDDIPQDLAAKVPVLWVSGSRFAQETSRSAVTATLERRSQRSDEDDDGFDGTTAEAAATSAGAKHTVIDLDYRPSFWDSPEDASREISAVLKHVSVAVGNRTECEIAVGTADPDAAADRLLEAGVKLAIIKKGADGVLVATESQRHSVPPFQIDLVCGLGAGDAFGGSLAEGLIRGRDPLETITRANAAGAIVAGRLACSDAMPTPDEIDELLARTA